MGTTEMHYKDFCYLYSVTNGSSMLSSSIWSSNQEGLGKINTCFENWNCIKTEVLNIQPMGQIWPAEPLCLAHQATTGPPEVGGHGLPPNSWSFRLTTLAVSGQLGSLQQHSQSALQTRCCHMQSGHHCQTCNCCCSCISHPRVSGWFPTARSPTV